MGGRIARLWRVVRRPSVLAMLDQALVSGASFLTTVLIGRFASAEYLGLYSMGIAVVLALLAVQMSLLTTPYAVNRHRPEIRSTTYAGSTMLMQLVLLLIALVGLLGAAAAVGGEADAYRRVNLAMAVAVPALLLREFARRMAYAHLSVEAALAIDVPVVAVQLIAIALLARAAQLTAATAFLALGVAAAVGAATGLVALRSRMEIDRNCIRTDAQRSWRFGRWIAGAQLLGVVNTQGVYWVVALVMGTAATGVYAACLAVVLLCNPFMLAIGNMLTPRAAATLAAGGRAALRRLIFAAAAGLAAVMTLFTVCLAFAGDRIVQLLYGAEYGGHGAVVTLLGLTFLVGAVGMALNDGIRALGRADVEFTATLLDSAITIGLGLVGLRMFGLVGLAWANLLGGVAALVLQAVAFARLMRVAGPSLPPPQSGGAEGPA